MHSILIILLVLLLLGAVPAYNYGPYYGGGVGVLFVILLVLLLAGVL
jgi:hypothetical protein